MRILLVPLLLIAAFQAFAAEPVLKFTLTKADGTPTTYEFMVPNEDTNQGAMLAGDTDAERQHDAGVIALAWAKQYYGAHEIYLRSVDFRPGSVPYYLAKFDGELAGARQVFFAIVLASGSVLEPLEGMQTTAE